MTAIITPRLGDPTGAHAFLQHVAQLDVATWHSIVTRAAAPAVANQRQAARRALQALLGAGTPFPDEATADAWRDRVTAAVAHLGPTEEFDPSGPYLVTLAAVLALLDGDALPAGHRQALLVPFGVVIRDAGTHRSP